MIVPAFYFDGQSSRRFSVTLEVRDGIAVVQGDTHRECPLDELRVSERLRRAPRKVTFPDGAYLEILDLNAFNVLLSRSGHVDPLVVRVQQSWRGALIAALATVVILVFGYLIGLPAASRTLAQAMPEQFQRRIGQETLAFLDRRMLAPSALSSAQQKAITDRFNKLLTTTREMPAYDIVFRRSRIGPNAFALSSGQIVLTDEIVKLVDDEDAVMGILFHELGHLHERHLMQRLIQASMTGAVITALFGDVSSVAANIPTVMLDLKYSRDAEREADDYAIAMLKKNGISPEAMMRTLEALEKKSGGGSPYFSTHPLASERIERIRAAH